MMPLVGIAVFLLAVTGIGLVALRALRPADPDRNGQLPLGLAFLMGAAVVGLALHAPLAIDGRITHLSFAIVAAVGLAAWAWIGIGCWRAKQRPQLWGWMADLPAVGKIMLGIALVPALIHSARSGISGYDARTIYGLKARILYDTGTVRSEDFDDIDRLNFNPGYPLLLPLLESEMDWAQGGYEAAGVKFMFLGFAVALASIFAGQTRRFEGASFSALTALLLLLTPIVLCCFEGAGLSGSADLPLAAFLFGGVLELSRWLESPNWRRAASAGLLLGAAALTKTEGTVWVAVCGGTMAVVLLFRRRPGWLRLGTVLPAGAMILLALALGRAVHRGMPDSPYYPSYAATLDWQWLRQLGDRPWTVAVYAAEEFFRVHNWNLIWPCVLGALFVLKRGRVPAQVWFWRLTAGGVACGYLAVLVLTPLHVHYQLYTSMTRLLLHIYPLAVLIMSEQLAASGWSRQFTEIFHFQTEADDIAGSVPVTVKQEERKRAA